MLAELLEKISAQGRSSFDLKDLQKLKKSSPSALRAAIYRSQMKHEIASPHRGFFCIIPPAYRSLRCIPADQFIPDLMDHLRAVYYVGLLSAAEYHGAAHQRPQVFQVVTRRARRPISCGGVAMEFVSKKKVDLTPTQQMNTRTGAIKVSTPEATALDLVGYVHHCGGLNNVATVLSELSESIDAVRLVGAAKLVPITWAQRVGYLIDAAGAKEKTSDLAAYVNSKSPVRASLSPGQAVKGAEMNKRWKLFLNTSVEADF